MARSRSGKITKNRHKKILKLAKGFRGRAKNCYVVAIQKVEKSLQYAYRDRKNRKRDFRALWIQRINAAAREHGIVYSQFIGGLVKAGIEIDRKVLSDIAIHNPNEFASIVEKAKSAMNA